MLEKTFVSTVNVVETSPLKAIHSLYRCLNCWRSWGVISATVATGSCFGLCSIVSWRPLKPLKVSAS